MWLCLCSKMLLTSNTVPISNIINKERKTEVLLAKKLKVVISNANERKSHYCFSTSLIIHEEKTKEMITMKEVWICDPNYHKIR